MQLLFFLGNDLIEAVPLDPEKIPVPGYLGRFKRSMRLKYEYLIMEASTLPEFLVMPFAAAGSATNTATA